jgi:hypothetical protein
MQPGSGNEEDPTKQRNKNVQPEKETMYVGAKDLERRKL